MKKTKPLLVSNEYKKDSNKKVGDLCEEKDKE